MGKVSGVRACSGASPWGAGGGLAGLALGRWGCGAVSAETSLGQPRPRVLRHHGHSQHHGFSWAGRHCAPPLGPAAEPLWAAPPVGGGLEQQLLVWNVLAQSLRRPRRCFASLGEGRLRYAVYPSLGEWRGVLACTRLLDAPEPLYAAGPSVCVGMGLAGDSSCRNVMLIPLVT